MLRTPAVECAPTLQKPEVVLGVRQIIFICSHLLILFTMPQNRRIKTAFRNHFHKHANIL